MPQKKETTDRAPPSRAPRPDGVVVGGRPHVGRRSQWAGVIAGEQCSDRRLYELEGPRQQHLLIGKLAAVDEEEESTGLLGDVAIGEVEAGDQIVGQVVGDGIWRGGSSGAQQSTSWNPPRRLRSLGQIEQGRSNIPG